MLHRVVPSSRVVPPSFLYTSRSGLASFSPAASLTQWPHRDEVYLQRCAPTPRGLDIHGLRTAPPSYQMPPRDLAMSGPLEEAADAGGPGVWNLPS